MKTLLPDAIVPDLPGRSPDAWILIGIVAAVAALTAVLIVVLIKRKKQRRK